LTYTSIWLQSFLGLSPIEAGLTGVPLSASSFLVSILFGKFLHSSAPGPITGGGFILIGGGALLSALLVGRDSSWPALIAGFVVCGLGVGLATPTLSSTAMGAVSPDRGGMAAGAVNTARQLGFAFGIAVLGSVFESRAAHRLQLAGVAGLVAGVTVLLLVRRFTPTPASAPASAPVPTSRAAVR
jgi:predicted MFS family arabinose efflux permease